MAADSLHIHMTTDPYTYTWHLIAESNFAIKRGKIKKNKLSAELTRLAQVKSSLQRQEVSKKVAKGAHWDVSPWEAPLSGGRGRRGDKGGGAGGEGGASVERKPFLIMAWLRDD